MDIRFSRQNLKQKYFQLRNRLKYIQLRRVKKREIKDIYANNPIRKEFKLNFDIFSKENAKRKMQNAKVILKFAF